MYTSSFLYSQMDGVQLFYCLFDCYNGNVGTFIHCPLKIHIARFNAAFFLDDDFCLYDKVVYVEKATNDEKMVVMDVINWFIYRLRLFCEMGWSFYHSCSRPLHMYRTIFALLW